MKKKTLGIIGSGQLGQQIANFALTDKHYGDVVFFDDFTLEKEINGLKVVGDTSLIYNSFHSNVFDELLIGIGYKHLLVRKKMHETYVNKIPMGRIVHSSNIIDPSACVEDGCIVYPGCIIDANATIKSNTILNLGCCIAHDSVVGSHCFLSPRVVLAGFVNVEECCNIGTNATVIDNIDIIANCQLGGGTVVIKSIEKSGLYVGNPAKFIR